MGLADLCLIQSCDLIKTTYWIKKKKKISGGFLPTWNLNSVSYGLGISMFHFIVTLLNMFIHSSSNNLQLAFWTGLFLIKALNFLVTQSYTATVCIQTHLCILLGDLPEGSMRIHTLLYQAHIYRRLVKLTLSTGYWDKVTSEKRNKMMDF